MKPLRGLSNVSRWLFPLLVTFLVVGHACDLPAYAAMIDAHATADEARPVEHEHGDDESALTCDGVLVVSSHGTPELRPGVVSAVMEFPVAVRVPEPALGAATQPIKLSTGPPLFVLFSSLLI